MRVVIKEWLKDKRASIALVIFCVASCAKIFVDARLIINIGITFANPDQWKYNLVILSALCLIRTSLGIIASVSNRWSRYKVFETMNNKFADKMLDIVKEIAPNVFKNAGAPCVRGKCTEGKMTCGNPRNNI